MDPDRGDAQARILDAATSLFATHGYAATTTRAIAERAGVNEVTLFRRFGSKQGVLRALAGRIEADTAGTATGRLDPAADLRDVLTALAATEVRAALRSGGLALRLAFDAPAQPDVAEVLGSGTATNAHRLAAYLGERQQGGDLRSDVSAALLAESFFALTSSLVLGRLLLGSPLPSTGDVDDLVSSLVGLYLDGALPHSSAGASRPAAPRSTRSRRTP